jgi:D-aminopeptidase
MCNPLKSVLVVVDLEGITGVTDLDALTAGTRKYKNACRAMACELGAICRGLLERGVERIVISDSHRGGSQMGNLQDCKLPAQCRVVHGEDAYDAALFNDTQALIAIGMHGAAGSSSFAAHTVGLHCDWWRGGQRLSESDILLALAHEAGVPTLFFSGDAELGSWLNLTTSGKLEFFATKTTASIEHCQSLSITETEPELYRLALTSEQRLIRPHCMECEHIQPLMLGFKSVWQADLSESEGRHQGVSRVGSHLVSVSGSSFREQYQVALRLLEATASPLVESWNCAPPSPRFLWNVRQQFRRPAPPRDISEEPIFRELKSELERWPLGLRIEAAWKQFEVLTCIDREDLLVEDLEFSLALRALVLHIAQSWCPKSFARLQLEQPLNQALDGLASIPQDYPLGLPASQAMARIDAAYILARRGLAFNRPNRLQLRAYVESIASQDTILAWMIAELAAKSGCKVGVQFAARPYLANDPGLAAQSSRQVWDLYWLAHELFFFSEYLTEKPVSRLPMGLAEEFLNAVESVVRQCHWDLGSEVALSLLYLGEEANIEFAKLLVGLLRSQLPSGRLSDNTLSSIMKYSMEDHATGLLLLLLARIDDQGGLNCVS